MKKALILLLGLTSLSVFAEQQPQQSDLPTQLDSRPMLKLAVVDKSNPIQREVEGRKYSARNKNHHLCWIAFNIPTSPQNVVSEIFIAPKRANFADQNGTTVSSKNGKKHTITSHLVSTNGESISKCWKFNNKDPKGKYSVEIKINDIVFPAQSFEVVK